MGIEWVIALLVVGWLASIVVAFGFGWLLGHIHADGWPEP